ncbi:hypothetical protein [Streptomyces venezuelae]|uniref:Uncharacterized protein n=1 Tax=Streptomyces venezuelae TaxID=54571 RepID=A0A5P2B9E0_STRVZ|nr:hypothetical protein [Streptomyces venezuelae]QES25821.1 hypothetical protein DEJ47_04575 [Streptomyces venezuelae]
MARLQILELPTEHHGDDMTTPFILVIDQADENTASTLDGPDTEDASYATAIKRLTGRSLAEQIGARAILVFETTVDIPANDTTAYSATPPAKRELVVNVGDHEVGSLIDEFVRKNHQGYA